MAATEILTDTTVVVPTRRIVLGIQYDGAPWQGWQKQPHGTTVQDRLEEALRRFSGEHITVVCAGRTDAGVHALEQVVHFDTSLVRETASWVRGVNAFLPPSIAVRWAHELLLPVSSDAGMKDGERYQNEFHARFSAIARTYHYVLYNHPVRSPLLVGKAGWTFRPLDAAKMQEGAEYLLGQHDFSSFRAVACQASTPVRTMKAISVQRRGDTLVLTLTANAFLQHMVRNIVGSLIMVGTGSKSPEWIGQVLAARNRSLAAPTFMSDGLYLARVEYPAQWKLPQENVAWPAW